MAGPGKPGRMPVKDRDAQLEVLEAHRQVLAAWQAGLSYPRIAEATGYSVWSVGEIVRGALGKLRSNRLEEHQDRHYARLEELYRALEPALINGIPVKEDVDSALKILDRESRLLGLDAPKRSQSEVTAGINLGQVDNPIAARHVADLVAWVKKNDAISTPGRINPPLPRGMTERVLPSGDASTNGHGEHHGREGHGMWSMVVEFPRED